VPAEFLHSGSRSAFRNRLLRWFEREKRSLPWRGERDPYCILVSEIMLQQTRVAVVKERYRLFLRRFPTVSSLARAKEETVLAAWSGLGYYRRARALHGAAKEICKRRAFPASEAELADLPGIGRYTAAAVASIAFGEPVAVVDGNVKRVLHRLSGQTLADGACWQTAQDLLDRRRPGDFNQAMMELGATVCFPVQPNCEGCPVARFCASHRDRLQRPPARDAKTSEGRKKAALNYLLLRQNGAVLVQRRPIHFSLMPGMWELPPTTPSDEAGASPVLRLRHSITNTDYAVSVFAGREQKPHSGR
jgi:A/G-specific adenine glycosylase